MEEENKKDENKKMVSDTWIVCISSSRCLHLFLRLHANQDIVFTGMVTIFFRIVGNIGANPLIFVQQKRKITTNEEGGVHKTAASNASVMTLTNFPNYSYMKNLEN